MPSRAVLLGRGLDTSHGLGFVRERVTLVGKTLFLVSFGFYLFLLASMVLVGRVPFLTVVTNRWPSATSLPAQRWACSGSWAGSPDFRW